MEIHVLFQANKFGKNLPTNLVKICLVLVFTPFIDCDASRSPEVSDYNLVMPLQSRSFVRKKMYLFVDSLYNNYIWVEKFF